MTSWSFEPNSPLESNVGREETILTGKITWEGFDIISHYCCHFLKMPSSIRCCHLCNVLHKEPRDMWNFVANNILNKHFDNLVIVWRNQVFLPYERIRNIYFVRISIWLKFIIDTKLMGSYDYQIVSHKWWWYIKVN